MLLDLVWFGVQQGKVGKDLSGEGFLLGSSGSFEHLRASCENITAQEIILRMTR